ncbi:hypothetical protein CPC08DRAFT_709839 [Agrocybe pediades]|nr:hypothetical protein CPC08DRAFT_709839 [Agrocybe pediades]
MRAESVSPSSTCSQIFPSDISRSGDSELIVQEVPESPVTHSYSLPAIFDPTTIEVGFDLTCFNGLDDTLIYSPRTAFEELCWDEVVETDCDVISEVPASTPTPQPIITTKKFQQRGGRESPARSFLVTSYSSEEDDDSDTDSDECRTLNEKGHRYYSHHPILRPNGVSTALEAAVGEFSSYDDNCFDYEDSGPFMLSSLDSSPFSMSNPKVRDESVGCFPVPVAPHRKTVPNRIAAFAHRLTFVRAAPS